jgi:hypothetical protein
MTSRQKQEKPGGSGMAALSARKNTSNGNSTSRKKHTFKLNVKCKHFQKQRLRDAELHYKKH